MHTVVFARVKLILSLMLICCSVSVSFAGNIIKSPNDDREYKSITLKNNLKVLLISDSNTDKAAASLDISVGSAANPKDRAGLAHFLEHMLFLGTEKYPEADEYQSFIQAHGGSHNAFTALKNTNYFFDIKADDLEPALDRFSQFFISPLFSEEYTDRERHAVHSEYSAKLKDDGRRVYAAKQQAMNPQHPASRFAVGNLNTLTNDESGALRKDLISFYQNNYSANRMRLVILGKHSIDQLESMAKQHFANIEDKALAPFSFNQPQFKHSDLPLEMAIKTLKDTRSLSLSFPTQPRLAFWQSKPLHLLSSLVGYEGKGSLLALLKEKGWATGLGASPGEDFDTESSFHIHVSLTPQGLQHSDEIVSLFFSFMKDLQKTGISQTLFEEERLLNAQQFRFLSEQEPIHYVTQLTQSMQYYPEANWLNAAFVIEQYNADIFEQFTQSIRPDNMVLSIQAPELETDKNEHYYNSAYRVAPISSERISHWQNVDLNNNLHIRNSNPFIAKDTQLKPQAAPSNQPEKHTHIPFNISTGKTGVSLWHLQDSTFNVPKADLYFTLLSPIAREGATVTAGLSLYADMVSDELNQTLYDAGMAGLSARIYSHQRGISVRISGFNDKIHLLSELIAKTLRSPELSQARFERILQAYKEQLKNADKDKPYNQLFRVSYEQLMHDPSLSDLQKSADNYTLQQLSSLVERLFQSAELRIMSHGNLIADEAFNISNSVVNAMQPINTAAVAPQVDIRRLTGENIPVTLQIDHNDSAVMLYLQGQDQSLKNRASTALLSEILSAPFYTQLRTEQQLGYIVFATPMSLRKMPGVALVVQSPSASPETVLERMNDFLDRFKQQIKEMTDKQIVQFKSSLKARINAQDRQLQDRSNRLWQEIDQDETNFDTREKLTESIDQLSNDDLVDAFDALLTRQLVLQNSGTGSKEANGKTVTN